MIQSKKLSNGFKFVEVSNDTASVKIALQGAHIFHYQRVGEEPVLWLSDIEAFDFGKSIRGGVPICWPWFGIQENLPQHGFARTSMFALTHTDDTNPNNTHLTFTLQDSNESRKLWNYKFKLELHVEIGDTLTMRLTTTNLDEKSFTLSQALHSYFDVSHISNVEINGLENKPYLDALTWTKELQKDSITFNKEVDRVYQEVDGKITLKDKNRTLYIENEGSSSVVVWNPWIDKCKRMSAMKDDDYKKMVCIESANAFDDTIVMKPKSSHTLVATVS
ncbi:D-hexose-6-phosphate mutarotase [Sulfurimonas sp.]|nr:D-hexose-6-phosphate mutarotase [Sulfurimonas sp.]